MPDIFRYIPSQHDLLYESDFITLINGNGVEIVLHATKEEIAKFDGYPVHDGLIELPNFITDDEAYCEPVYEELDRWHPTDNLILRYLRANAKDCTIIFDGGKALWSENVKVLHAAIQQGIRVEVSPQNDLVELAKEVKQLAHEFLKQKR